MAFSLLSVSQERNRNVLQNHSRGWDRVFCALFCRNETGISFRISNNSRNKPIFLTAIHLEKGGPKPAVKNRVIELERRVLQALCQRWPDESLRETALRRLSSHRWREATHQVIFGCLTRAPQSANAALRDHLAACATRKGFPDIDWEHLFEPVSLSNSAVERLIKELADSK